MSSGYYPAGVGSHNLPGFNVIDVTRHLDCDRDNDDDERCGFSGDVEGTSEHGITHLTCPRCGAEHQHDEN